MIFPIILSLIWILWISVLLLCVLYICQSIHIMLITDKVDLILILIGVILFTQTLYI